MKLQHLPIGARFEYEGKVFVKTGPLTASSDQGGQRVIPRYAVLKPLDLPETGSGDARGKLNEAAIKTAFQEFYLTCSQLVDEASRPELERARKRFLAALK
jgi:hypothetical protein